MLGSRVPQLREHGRKLGPAGEVSPHCWGEEEGDVWDCHRNIILCACMGSPGAGYLLCGVSGGRALLAWSTRSGPSLAWAMGGGGKPP